jgi:predicted AlkP superfamily phosphohydrolase/phosphomutase
VRDAYRALRRRTDPRKEARNGVAPAAAARVGALGRPIDEETDRSPDEIGVPRSSVDWQVAARYRAWWPAMRAFALPTFYDGRVRINLRGRERDGVVALEDYDAACREVEDAVAACRDPRTGEPVLAEVRRLRATEPLDPHGPDADLQLIWSHATDSWEHPDAGTIGPFPYRRTGGHSPRGFAFVAGPGIEPGELGARSAFDVTPTVLDLLGRDAAAGRVEGRSLLDHVRA